MNMIPQKIISLHSKFVIVYRDANGKKQVRGNSITDNWNQQEANIKSIGLKQPQICSKIDLHGTNICCIDVDDNTTLEELIKINPIFAKGLKTKGNNKGHHAYFQGENNWIVEKTKKAVKVFKDFEGDFLNDIVFEDITKEWYDKDTIPYINEDVFKSLLTENGKNLIFNIRPKVENNIIQSSENQTEQKRNVDSIIIKSIGKYNSTMCIDPIKNQVKLTNKNPTCLNGIEHSSPKDCIFINNDNIVHSCLSGKCENRIIKIPEEDFDELKQIVGLKVVEKELSLCANDFENGSENIAKKLVPTLKKYISFCNGSWYVIEPNNIWSIVKKPYPYIATHINKAIDKGLNALNKKLQETTTEQEAIRKKINNHSSLYNKVDVSSLKTGIIENLTKMLKDNNFYRLLDDNPYTIAFKNGLYNIKTKTFTEGIKPEDYITKTLQYDYDDTRNETHEKWLKKEFLKICNNNEEHMEYIFSIIGYALSGDSTKYKHIYSFIGQSASNGKTTILTALTDAFPEYVAKGNSDMIDSKCANKHHKYLTKLKGNRLVWLEEIAESAIIDSRLIKLIADGDIINNEVLFGTNEDIINNSKLFSCSNHSWKFNKADEGISRRFNHIQLDSHFSKDHKEDNYEKKQFKVDYEINKKIQERKMSLFHILMEYANKVFTNGLPNTPQEFINEKEETMEMNKNVLQLWIEENINFHANGQRVSKKEIKEAYENAGNKVDSTFDKQFRDEMKKLGVTFNRNTTSNGNRGVFIDISLKPPTPM